MADIIKQMLSRYEIQTKEDKKNATHEVMQHVCLAGLQRADFFKEAAFYGGTCLRIFHQLPRFSEDMDFSLIKQNTHFNLENYFEAIESEFKSLGRQVSITKKTKKQATTIESAFLKDNTDIINIRFQTEPSIKIKLEVDTQPPLQFKTEAKLLILPYSFMVKCVTLPSMFAGKMHAILFRQWKNRVKGRDWYDFEWYIRQNVALDLQHFAERTSQSENISKIDITAGYVEGMLAHKIANTDIKLVKADVQPFIINPQELDIWSTEYFQALSQMLQINNGE